MNYIKFLYPIFVDLDGTLLKKSTTTILLCEAFKQKKIQVLFMFFCMILINQRHIAKSILTRNIKISEIVLNKIEMNINKDVLNFIITAKNRGYRIYLATGANEIIANEIINLIHRKIEIFDGFIASNNYHNTVSTQKLQEIIKISDTQGFIYLGNAFQDIPIWKKAKLGIIVQPSFILKLYIKSMQFYKGILFLSQVTKL